MSKDQEDKEFTVADHVSKEKLRMIQDTYSIYSEDAIEVKHKTGTNNPAPGPKPAETKPPEVKGTGNLIIPEPEAPKKEIKKSKFSYDPGIETKSSCSCKLIRFKSKIDDEWNRIESNRSRA